MAIGRIMISGESRLFREGLSRILDESSVKVIGAFTSLEATLELLTNDSLPDLILCDPAADAYAEFAVMKHITLEFPSVRMVIITNDLRPSLLDCAIENGACGFLPQDLSPEALKMLLKLVLLGENIFPGPHQLLKESNPAQLHHDGGRDVPTANLSNKETEVLKCLGSGMSNKLIARNLSIAEATVKVHIKSLLRKINIQNRTQAAIWALSHQLPDKEAEATSSPSPGSFPRNRCQTLSS